jgi:hypothetical protein
MQASSSVATRISALVVVLFSGLTPSVGWAKLKILAPEVSDPTGQATPASVGEVGADSCHRVGGAHMCDLITPLGKIWTRILRLLRPALLRGPRITAITGGRITDPDMGPMPIMAGRIIGPTGATGKLKGKARSDDAPGFLRPAILSLAVAGFAKKPAQRSSPALS